MGLQTDHDFYLDFYVSLCAQKFASEFCSQNVILVQSSHFVCIYLADILSAFCIPMGCEGTLIDLPFI